MGSATGTPPAVAKASYVDPRIVDMYEHGKVIDLPTDDAERAVLDLLG